MNPYEPDNPLQLEWDEASDLVMCLCTMRESCVHCDGDSTQRRRDRMNDVIDKANAVGYQLYKKPGYFLSSWSKEFPIKMRKQTTSGMEFD